MMRQKVFLCNYIFFIFDCFQLASNLGYCQKKSFFEEFSKRTFDFLKSVFVGLMTASVRNRHSPSAIACV